MNTAKPEEVRQACEELKAGVLEGLTAPSYDARLLWKSWLNYKLIELIVEGEIIPKYVDGKLCVLPVDPREKRRVRRVKYG